MKDPFESPKFLLQRANDHWLEFGRLETDYLFRGNFETQTVIDPVTNRQELWLRSAEAIPNTLRGPASDAIKNLKDALDQAMAAASFVVSGLNGRYTHFPFGESKEDLEYSLTKRKVKYCSKIPESLFPVIRKIKPYPHAEDKWRLKVLQRVSGSHKRSMSLTLGTRSGTDLGVLEMIGFGENGSAVNVRTIFHEWNSSEINVLVATTTGLPSGGSFKCSQPFRIVFNSDDLKGVPASSLIDGWGQGVSDVIRRFEGACTEISSNQS